MTPAALKTTMAASSGINPVAIKRLTKEATALARSPPEGIVVSVRPMPRVPFKPLEMIDTRLYNLMRMIM